MITRSTGTKTYLVLIIFSLLGTFGCKPNIPAPTSQSQMAPEQAQRDIEKRAIEGRMQAQTLDQLAAQANQIVSEAIQSANQLAAQLNQGGLPGQVILRGPWIAENIFETQKFENSLLIQGQNIREPNTPITQRLTISMISGLGQSGRRRGFEPSIDLIPNNAHRVYLYGPHRNNYLTPILEALNPRANTSRLGDTLLISIGCGQAENWIQGLTFETVESFTAYSSQLAFTEQSKRTEVMICGSHQIRNHILINAKTIHLIEAKLEVITQHSAPPSHSFAGLSFHANDIFVHGENEISSQVTAGLGSSAVLEAKGPDILIWTNDLNLENGSLEVHSEGQSYQAPAR